MMSDDFQLLARDATGARSVTVDLHPGKRFSIGRLSGNDIAIVWDREVSREHAVVELVGSDLKVACLESGRNPISLAGQQGRQFTVKNGQQFQIGQTVFRFTAPIEMLENAPEDASGYEEISYMASDLRRFNLEQMSKQMTLLCDLPDMIAAAKTDLELGQMLCRLLLAAVPQAQAVAVAEYDKETVDLLKDYAKNTDRNIRPKMMRVQTRDDYEGRFMPSRRLVSRAFTQGNATVHIWTGQSTSGIFTMADSLDWAYCVPVSGEACLGWCLYVSGQGGKQGGLISKEDLEPDVRFTQLLTQFIASIRSVRLLQKQQTQLSSFFSPKVIENLTGSDDVLAPSERDITVLFCDVRGFSRKSEKHKDNLLYLLSCVREALSSMTDGILKFDGAIADFQGDAALGFWGWPVTLKEGAMPACRAALAIQNEFLHPEQHHGRLDGFTVGIGVAHGRAIAGQIGTSQQAKIGVFGPVVNQGSRLEGLTKQFGVSICLDEKAAEFARQFLPREQGRVRRLARVRPKGMETPITVSQLLPPYDPELSRGAGSTTGMPTVGTATMGNMTRSSLERNLEALDANNIPDDHLEDYETVLDLIIAGSWQPALPLLMALPEEGPKDFLLEQMARYENTPPSNWDGAFSLTEK